LAEMGSIEILVSAIGIARYFCIDIGIDLVCYDYECTVHRHRFSMFFCIADASISIRTFSALN